ncbi:magnesium transporter [Halomarina ordinaria]|uniref:Magnesium transporter n=1 Tax=Halomarina ordinaria TaxID=3033939 RepID=A0ABD5UIR0_9EURY|nr:magnesium transporter [Halomarina sp. PSRA2]
MAEDLAEIQQEIAASSHPTAEFSQLSRSRQRDVFFLLPQTLQESLVEDLTGEELQRFVRRLDPDEVADVLGFADETTRTDVLQRLDEDRREKAEFLLEFSPESAAGLMHLDYVTVDATRDIDDVAHRVQRYEDRTGNVPTIFVTEDDELVGELPGQALAMADTDDVDLHDYVQETPAVTYDTPDTEVVDVLREHPESSVAVLDDDRTILGVIYAGDLLRVIEEEAGETLYEFTGVREEESILDGPLTKVRYRYKWLIINLGTAFLAAAAVGFFEDTIAAFTLLAVYMPVVAGMGGNAGTQSMAVTVRGIALEQVSLSTGRRAVINEIIAGGANGLITGVLVAAIASVFNQSPLLGLVLGVSMILNLIIAGFFGTTIPLVLERIGKDPATSATIFITTATDVLGFFIFLGLAQSVL